MRDSLEPAVVQPLLRGRFGRDYRYTVRTASTQRLLDDAAEGAVAVADEQTEGRGRLGRTWEARPGTSILASVVLEPPVPSARLPELTLLAGGACVEAITAVAGLSPTIKHPNDVLVDGRKVAGILGRGARGPGRARDRRQRQRRPGGASRRHGHAGRRRSRSRPVASSAARSCWRSCSGDSSSGTTRGFPAHDELSGDVARRRRARPRVRCGRSSARGSGRAPPCGGRTCGCCRRPPSSRSRAR